MKKIFSITLMIFMLGIAQAQVSNLSVPFSFGFEEADSLLLRNWHFNVDCDTSICKERWLVGSYVKTEGKRSLYISADEGVTSEYDTIVNTTYAYVDFTVPSGQYELSFDWRCLGGADSYLCAGIGIAGNMPNNRIAGYHIVRRREI
ncbi:MAG: hypothetical protein IJS05_03725 [Paludibacteraceae bacterium]|nr:hypothetical protein [Paludibacteraceae bacterium]